MTRKEKGDIIILFFVILEEDWIEKRGIGIGIKGEKNEGKIEQINTNKDGNEKNNKIIVKNNITW